MDIGSAVGRALGLDESELADIARYRTSDRFSARDRLALELAEAMTATPCEVTDELRDRALEEFTRAEFAELAATIAWENHRARLNRALGVRPEGFSEGAYCVVPEHATG